MRVFVYANRNKNTWSVRALEGPQRGKVIAHSDYVLLANAVPRVSEAGRLRALRKRQRNVHAGIVGDLVSLDKQDRDYPVAVTYNPFKYTQFVRRDNGEPFTGADEVYFQMPPTSCFYQEAA